MPAWTDLAVAYAGYLTIVAWARPRFASARTGTLLVALACAAVWAAWPDRPAEATSGRPLVHIVVPSLVLLMAYRASGPFFVAPDLALERRLSDMDEAALGRTGILDAYRTAPAVAHEIVELFYLLVYVVVPLGATVLVLGGRIDRLETYWAVVFTAELACYAALPWLQTRPPRAIESEWADAAVPLFRRWNLVVLGVGSIQVNTFPSAHAAGAVAVALAVTSAMPAAGAVFAVIALGIVTATVLGRYHYLADSVVGVLVGVAAWAIVGA